MKDKKRRRIYIHEPEAASFVASTSTANRIRSVLIDAPVTTPAVEVDTSTPPTATFDYALGELNDTAMDNIQQTDSSGLVVKAKAKRYINSDAPLLTWKTGYRQQYLDATLLLDGRGRYDESGCTQCGGESVYRCTDCHGHFMYCAQCIVELHRCAPLHCIEGWESASPGRRWLYGLILQEDANFKQKSRLRSADNRDPALGPGWATFVAGDTYFDHLSKYVDPEEVGACDNAIKARSLKLMCRRSTTVLGSQPFGDSLLKKMTLAIPQAAIHHQAFRAFTDGLHEQHSEELLEWENQVRAWELDHDQPCPFDLPRDNLTMSDLKKEMAEEEHRRVQRGEALPGDTSPSNFIITGLDIEATQQELLVTASKHDLTTVEATQLQTSRTALLKKIKKFRDTQNMYMPGLADYIKEKGYEESTSSPELIELFLPSFFASTQRDLICQQGLPEFENHLRFAQATEALAHLRRQLRTRSFANSYKTRNAHSQGAYTRSRLLQNQIEVRIKAVRAQYDISRRSLLSLRGPGDWENTLKVLRAEDIRGINERTLNEEEQEEYRRARLLAGMSEETVEGELHGLGTTSGQENIPTVAFNRSLALGEGRRTLSWIWYTVTDEELMGVGEVQAC
ncbi:hypothetical protein EYR40_002561 [Pleurotus pulmonarius]|nr:hypothetical protein EYR40_002561 [Pleurotus pulmonarius]